MNNATFDYSDLLRCFGDGASHLPSGIQCNGVSTDTRTLSNGNIFVALRGETFDGHDHVHTALASGASLCIVEESSGLSGAGITCVPSTLHALGTLGWYHRQRFQIPVVAIAGSAGKTSTKELVAHVLREDFTVLHTKANHNNRIGTPQTLLSLNETHTAAVIEIGTNEPGEIELLAAMVQPTHGLITQIGKEHLEKLIDLDGVEREETALFDYLRDSDGVLLVNADDERLRKWYNRNGGRGVTFGIEQEADFKLQLTFDNELHPILHIVASDGGMRAVLKTTGLAAGLNGVAAFAVAKVLGMRLPNIKRGLESYLPDSNHGYARLVVQQCNNLAVLNDTYNANPESMLMALRTLQAYPATHRIVVLGDMRELGSASALEHQSLLTTACTIADEVITMGDEFAHAALDHSSVHVCQTHKQCANVVKQISKQGTAVLVKGSRGMTMEKVITELGGN